MIPGSSRTLALAAAAFVALAATAAVGVSGAAFTATTANPGNSFTAAATFPNMRVVSGYYSGNATDNRAFSGLGFQPDLVIVKGDTTQRAVFRTSTMTGDAAKPVGDFALAPNLVQSLNADGFTVGTDARVNASSTTYYWTAMKAADGVMKLGTYTGNGAASRQITGAGFSPEYVNVISAAANAPRHRMAGFTSGFGFDPSIGATDSISSLDADGFSVGANATTNTTGTTYHWVAWNEKAGQVETASYVGDGSSARSITGSGFEPYYLQLRANDTVTGRPAVHRSQASLFDSVRFDAVANESNAITALESDGFQVGANADTNAAGVTYHYVAFRDATGSCSAPGTIRFAVTNSGTYVDQSAPTSNFSSDTSLRVRSASGGNRRALVKFDNLPAAPPGCSLTDADLYMNATASAGGRTIQVFRASTSWTAETANWNNQPGTTGTAANSPSLGSAGWQAWDVTAHVQAMYSGPNDGFVIRDQTEGAGTAAEQVYKSDNAASDNPVLLVTFG